MKKIFKIILKFILIFIFSYFLINFGLGLFIGLYLTFAYHPFSLEEGWKIGRILNSNSLFYLSTKLILPLLFTYPLYRFLSRRNPPQK